MSIQWWNGVLNVITNIDYLAIPVAFIVLRNLREADVPPRVLVSRVLFVLACGAHHGVMAAVLFTGHPLWVLRTVVNVAMAGVSCWSVVEHLRWARIKAPPISARDHQVLEQLVEERTRDLNATLDELNQAQGDLIQSERLAVLGRLSSSLGHELRNPLGVMANAVYYLEAIPNTDDPRIGRYHHIIREQIALSERIVENLLDFSRVKEPTPRCFQLLDVVQEQVERIDLGAIELRMPDAGIETWADRFQVGQALYNIMTNACQAMEDQPNPRLDIRIGTRGGRAMVQIADNGRGMEEESLARVFEPLYTTKARGIGLGMAIARAYLDVNGGAIEVTSVPGEGAEFTVLLPIAPPVSPPVESHVVLTASTGRSG